MASAVFAPQGTASSLLPPTLPASASALTNGGAIDVLSKARMSSLVNTDEHCWHDVRMVRIPSALPRSWPPRPRTDAHLPRQPLGDLARFPDELLLTAVGFLDFRSLDRLRQVSRRARDIIEGLEVWADLLRHAPAQLHALHRSDLLGLHPASRLQAVLRESVCASCLTHFGGFLFLMTCERACLSCLRENPALRVTIPDVAARCFGLSDEQVATLPSMVSIPQRRLVLTPTWWTAPIRLVSVRHAKELALALHGGELPPPSEAGALLPNGGRAECADPHDPLIFDVLRHAPLEPPGRDLSLCNPRHLVEDDYLGAAIVRTPSLRPSPATHDHQDGDGDSSPLEHGRLCRGCSMVHIHFEQHTLPTHVISSLCPPELNDKRRPIEAAVQRLWSKEGFIDHVGKCYGARHLIR